MSLKIRDGNVKLLIQRLDSKRLGLKTAGRQAVRAAGHQLALQVKRHVSVRDHTLADLAALDHPYARRHGSIKQIHADAGGSESVGGGMNERSAGFITDARHFVHRRSGEMQRSVRSAARHGPVMAWDVWFDTSAAPHVRDVLEGTSVMLPRDPLWATATSPNMRARMMTRVIEVLTKSLAGRATVTPARGTP